jgi:hypothetical protein
VVGADPSVNVGQKGLALFPGDVAEFDSPLAAMIELAINQQVHLGLAGNSFFLDVIFWQFLKLEILHQLLRPGGVALSARAATGSGLGFSPVAGMTKSWRVVVAGTTL